MDSQKFGEFSGKLYGHSAEARSSHDQSAMKVTVKVIFILRIIVAVFLSMAAIPACADTGHNPLMPSPQQVRYGTHHLVLDGLAIHFSSPPSVEDRFAAKQLSVLLLERTGIRTRISDTERSGRAIILDRTGPADPLAVPGEQPGPGSREAYDVTVTTGGAKIHSRSSAGVFYGVQTLAQLVEGSGAEAALPEAEVHDWPALAFRGTMVDMSHGPLPTEEEVKRQLDFLARWKANQYFLYNEASVELSGFPLLNPEGRFTKDEVRRIVAYGRERHIDVIPNLELYAHLHDLFRIEKYADLADLPHGTEFDPRNPKVMNLLTDWINQFSELFSSPFVNIGFDETFQIEMANQSQGAGSTPTQLFIRQLTKVANLFQQHGKHVLAWGDIMVRYPQIVRELPHGLIAVAWYYTSEDKNYTRWLRPLVEHAVPYFVQPAVTSWAQIAPDFDTSFENIDTFLAAGRRSNVLGMINSVWADDAQLLFRMSLPGMAYGAAAPWQSTPMDRQNFFSTYAQIMYPRAIAGDVGSALTNIARSETILQKVLGPQTMFALWQHPFVPAYRKALNGHAEDLRETRLRAEDAETSLYHALANGGDAATLNSLIIGTRLLDYAGQRFQTPLELTGLWQRLGSKRPGSDRWWNEWESQVVYQDHSRIVDLLDAITELRARYRAEWLTEYTPYRLDSALGKWNGECQYWQTVQERLQQFSDSSHEGDSLPPIEQIIGAN
jgi:hexosaminidase